ncbi:MAG: thioredoxin family protein [Planctomycetota bacterium]
MRRALVPALVVAAGSSSAVATQSGEVRWYDDLERARTVARTENKHVLVEFAGSSWCAWCKKLEDRVLSRPTFCEPACDEFVLVRLDFDERGRARGEGESAVRSDAFRAAVGASAFPTVLLMTADGIAYAREGYDERGPREWADWVLDEHRRTEALRDTVPTIVGAIAGANSPEEARAASARAATVLERAGAHVFAKPLVPIVRTILGEPDVTDARERLAVRALVAADAVDGDVLDRAFRLDPSNAEGLPEGALGAMMASVDDPELARALILRAETLLRTGSVHDPQRAARLYGDCAHWSRHELDDPDRARALARFALSLEPKDERLRAMLEALSGI